jgi:predicted ATPase
MRVLAVENYRSLRHPVVPLGPLNIVTGSNGSGKSSLYRALRLLADASHNGAVAALAREGGLDSTLWAGADKLERGAWTELYDSIRPYESMLSELADPQRAPEVLRLREQIRSWRFSDHLRTRGRARPSQPGRHQDHRARPRRRGPRGRTPDDPRDRRRPGS